MWAEEDTLLEHDCGADAAMRLGANTVAKFGLAIDHGRVTHRYVGADHCQLPDARVVADERVCAELRSGVDDRVGGDDRPRPDHGRHRHRGRTAGVSSHPRDPADDGAVVDPRPVPDADLVVDDDVGADLDFVADLHPGAEQQVGGQIGSAQGIQACDYPGMGAGGKLGATAICCLLNGLNPGGSTWQWIRLLERHVEDGGRATVFAADGSLAEPARAAGVEVIPTTWDETGARGGISAAIAEHDVAIVEWEQGVMQSFPRALDACGRAALAMHVTPQSVTRWLAPPAPMKARRTVEHAVADPRAVALVRGEAHRRKVATAYSLAPEALRILPASVPLPSLPFCPKPGEAREVLAMTRLAPEKTAIVRVAVELVRERLATGRPCGLTIAGDGLWKPEAVALCEQHLPSGSWRIEDVPEDPTARLADSDLVVAQGTTTLEAAALGRRVVVARPFGAHGASGAVLTPDRYDEAARDPFGDPRVTEDTAQLWEEIPAIDETALRELRHRVETHNSLEVALRALDDALAGT